MSVQTTPAAESEQAQGAAQAAPAIQKPLADHSALLTPVGTTVTLDYQSPVPILAELTLPLNALDVHPENMRFHEPEDGPEFVQAYKDMAPSIAKQGLIQRLIVTLEGPSQTEVTEETCGFVCAGRTRLFALRWLAQQGVIYADHPVQVRVVAPEHAADVSVDENVWRTDPHPATLVRSFQYLHHQVGRSVADLAKQYRCSQLLVRRHLALASVAPEVLEAWRQEKIDRDCVAAFSVCPSLDRQVEVLNALQASGDDLDAYTIRGELSMDRHREDGPLMAYVGAEAYKLAGGTFVTDLFDEQNKGRLVADPDLLERLATERLTAIADAEKEAGAAWVRVSLRRPNDEYMLRPVPTVAHWSEEQNQRREELQAALKIKEDAAEAFADEHPEAEEWEPDDEQLDDETRKHAATLAALYSEADAIKADLGNMRPQRVEMVEGGAEVAGALVYVDHAGKLNVKRHLAESAAVRKLENRLSKQANHQGGIEAGDTQAGGSQASEDGDVSAKLALHLSILHTAAMQHRMSQQPELALRLLCANQFGALLRHVAGEFSTQHSGFALGVTSTSPTNGFREEPGCKDNPGAVEVLASVKSWQEEFLAWAESQADQGERDYRREVTTTFGFVQSLSLERVQALLALCVATTLDVRTIGGKPELTGFLVETLDVDMHDYWQADKTPYLSRRSRAQVLAELAGAGVTAPPEWLKMKKAELVAVAGPALAQVGYLPGAFRRA